jgi:hypothetical protein
LWHENDRKAADGRAAGHDQPDMKKIEAMLDAME